MTATAAPVAESVRLDRLERSLARHLTQHGVRVTPFRQGVDCWVDRVDWPGAPPAVVRSARVERLMTRYEGLVDFGAEIARQAAVASLLRDHGIPTPAVLAWNRSADPDAEPSWMVLDYVEQEPGDWTSAALQADLGRVARRINAIVPSGVARTLLPPPRGWAPWLTNRILARVAAAERYLALPDLAPVRRAVSAVASARAGDARQLLHLDLRPPNLVVRDGRIAGVLDLANAIVGDPWLELARVRGCGLLTPAFLEGYGAPSGFEAALDVYELDLSALLVVVSREEFDDLPLHAQMAERTLILLERILS